MKKNALRVDGKLGVLSPLEQDVLEVLWKRKTATAKEIHSVLKKKRKVASSSVSVILDRLHNRKWVKRKIETCQGGFKYIYTPAYSYKDCQKAVLQRAVDSLINTFGESAVTYFNDRFRGEK